MIKILVVDDEADLEILIKQKFRKRIREGELEFLFALNGRIALEILDANKDVDMILSDINMPEMDGLTLLSKVKEKHSLLKTVIISAYGDMENIRTAMNLGAFDFITKPVDFQDLEITIEKTTQYINQVKSTLKALKENNILKMYVDETVLNFMGNREIESGIW
ncbi:MAG: adenylate cyclase, partial [Algoriphagus sp.]